MPNASPLVTVMMAAARKGARVLSRDFGEVENLQASRKGPADFVTAADKMCEEKIYESLRHDRPGYGYLLEERGEVAGSDKTHRFIIDPLDGTTNFMHGNPHFAISIGVEREGALHAGVIYDLMRDEMFFAENGQGAFLIDSRGGEKRLRVPNRDDLSMSLIATGMPWMGKPGHAKFLKEAHQIMARTSGIRRNGAASLDLAWTAAGRFDGFWERGLLPWDMAAGIVIAREAGALVQELDSGDDNPMESGNILCASKALFPQLQQYLST